MRTVIVNNIVSLDGYYADADGNPLRLNMDAEFDRANREDIERAGTVLLGRESFNGFSAYWPFIADAPEPSDPHSPESRRFSDVNRAISARYNSIPKVVVSDHAIDPDNPWADTTTVVSRDKLLRWLADERRRDGDDILIFGSRRTWNRLLVNGLVDELHLMVSPCALGDGVKLFDEPTDLELIGCRSYQGSGNVQLRYRLLPHPTDVDASTTRHDGRAS